MSKKVLILCTGNSCRSIMAEAIINATCKGIYAESSGVKALGKVNENAKKVLEKRGVWDERYHSKNLDKLANNKYDLVVSVCENAKNCPVFTANTKHLHVGFDDPDGKEYGEFEKTYEQIQAILIPKIKKILA